MSHLPLSLMNRLNKIESAVFIFWMLSRFPNDPLSDYLGITTSVIVPCSGPKKSPHIYRLSVVIFTFSGPL